ncbi:MAG: SprB repeat-containing protein [Bacteroidales bacterium]|nr:SprB repeat-containing protein [Bacteroidales bacterium]
MISEREKYEMFENYLKGSLDRLSKDAFEDALRNDPVVNHEFQEYREAHRLIIESRLLDIRQELENLHTAKLKTGQTQKGIRNIMISAGIILSGILLYVLLNRSDEIPRQENHLPDTGTTHAKTSDTAHEESRISGMHNETDRPDHQMTTATVDTNVLFTDLDIENKDAGHDKKMKRPAEDITKHLTKEVNDVFETQLSIPPVDTSLASENRRTENEINDLLSVSDCEKVIISCEYMTENTCSGQSQGRIIFITHSLKGGTPPYEFSIDSGTAFEERTLFDNLQSGKYRLFVRDAHQCISETGLAEINSVECDFRFAPGLGEVWDIPFITDKNGKLSLYSKEGKLFYSAPVGPHLGKTWDGRSLQGEMMPLGVYMFQLSFKDGSRHQGTVTIIK